MPRANTQFALPALHSGHFRKEILQKTNYLKLMLKLMFLVNFLYNKVTTFIILQLLEPQVDY